MVEERSVSPARCLPALEPPSWQGLRSAPPSLQFECAAQRSEPVGQLVGVRSAGPGGGRRDRFSLLVLGARGGYSVTIYF